MKQTPTEYKRKIEKSNEEFFEVLGLDPDIRKHTTGFNIGDMVLVQILRELRALSERLWNK